MVTILTSIIAFITDQYTKKVCKRKLESKEEVHFMNEVVDYKLYKNKGIFLSHLHKKPLLVKCLHVLALCFVTFAMIPVVLVGGSSVVEKIGFGLFIGGGAGNLYDRFKHGAVIDFFSFKFLPKVVFNVADMFVGIGSVMILIGQLLKR